MTLVTRAFLPLLVAARGHVVNLGSGASLLPFPGYAAYGPVKVGVLWLSEYLRAELGPLGVRVSCVCPLLVRTRWARPGRTAPRASPSGCSTRRSTSPGWSRRAIGSRRFLVYGSLLLHVLHLLYRWARASCAPCSRPRPEASCARVRRRGRPVRT